MLADYLKDKRLKNLPILFSACDLGVIYDEKLYNNILKNKKFDLIVWTTNKINDAKLNPHMYGWISLIIMKLIRFLLKNNLKIIRITTYNWNFMFKINIFEKCYKI